MLDVSMIDTADINTDLITVIVPCYNYGYFIPETLDSIQRQTYENWECIVVDDGSTDNTRDIVYRYISKDNRFKYIYQTNKGLSAARNTGIKNAKGDYLQFLDADDLIEKRKLELQLNYFLQYPDVGIVYGDVRYFSSERPGERFYSMSGDNKPWIPKISGKGKVILNILIERNIMAVNSALVKKKAIDICGLFDEALKAHEDWDYWLRCALHDFSFAFLELPETNALVRYHLSSMTHNPLLMLSTQLELQHKLGPVLTDYHLKLMNKKTIANLNFGLLLADEKMRYSHRLLLICHKLLLDFSYSLKIFLYKLKFSIYSLLSKVIEA